jgi:uncharacterized protein YjiS (DUF1127 family)
MNQICANQDISPRSEAPNRSWTGVVRAVDAGIDALVETLLTWQRRRKDRLHLMSLDDHMLHDIGVSLADVEQEASKPFWRA